MTPSVDPIELDPPDDQDPRPAFPDIPDWEVTDGYSDVKARLVFAEGETVLVLTHGDPTLGPFQMMRVELDPADLARLAADHIAPLMAYENAEAQRTNTDLARSRAHDRARADAAAFVVLPDNLSPTLAYQVRLHRNGCPAVVRVQGERRGERTHGGSHTGHELMDVLDKVDNALSQLRGDHLPRTHTGRPRNASANRRTGVVYEPLKLCGTCKPMGRITPALANEIRALARYTQSSPQVVERAASVMTRLREAVWEVEQDHLARLRGDETEPPAPDAQQIGDLT